MSDAGPRLDELARLQLDDEAQLHREALATLTDRSMDAVLRETDRHLGRVRQIMRELAARALDSARGPLPAVLAALLSAA